MKLIQLSTTIALATTLFTSNVFADEPQYEYVVIGAGSAGLSAAYKLQSLDKEFIVLERNTRPGGIAENGVRGRFHYAKGTEYLGEPEGYLADVIQDLKIPMVEIPLPMDASFFQGEMYIGDKELARLTIEQAGEQEFQKFIDLLNGVKDLKFRELRKLDNITAKQWLDDNQIPPFIQQRYKVMSRGLFGANLTDISALSFIPEAIFDYVDVEEVSDVMEPDTNGHSESWTTQTGIATIATSIAKNLDEHIRYQSSVKHITKVKAGYQVEFDVDGKVHTLTSEKVIVATPAPVAAYIASDVLTAEQISILGQVDYAQYATVALFSETPIFNKAFDLAILDGKVITDLYDATWVERHHNPELSDVKEYIASVYLAPQGVADKSLLKNSDAEIMDIIFTELNAAVPDIKDKVSGYDIKRFYHAYPVFNKGYFTRLHQLKSSFSGVYLAGDYMSYPTFDAAFESGFEAVIQAEGE